MDFGTIWIIKGLDIEGMIAVDGNTKWERERELKDKKVTECGRKSTDSNKRGADSSVSVRQGWG